MHTGYQILPEVYDRWQLSYGKDFSSLILPRLLSTIATYRIPMSTLLDLACGTGTLALMMAGRGWNVVAVDASDGMIREAVRKRRGSRLPVAFFRQDMRSLTLKTRAGLVTCMFDAINHLTSARDVLRCFRRVYSALLPGGYFVFDVNNEMCFRTVWRQTDVIHEQDFTMILQNSFDLRTRKAVSNVTVFVRKGRTFRKKTEKVQERYYPPEEIRELLHQAGLELIEYCDFNFTPDPMVGEIKTWWVARRPESSDNAGATTQPAK